MTTYYIDPSSPTNGTGTFASPFNTWASVTWAAGNTYLQKAGTTQTGYRILITVGGTSLADRVIIGSYDPSTGAKTTNGLNRAILNGAGTAQTIRVNQGVNYVWIDNFEVYGTDGVTGTSARAIYIGNGAGGALMSNNVEISNCFVHDVKSDLFAENIDCNAIQVFGDYAIIRNNIIRNIPADGIWLQGSNYRITDNDIANVSTRYIQGDCIQTNGDATTRNDNGYIARNKCDHSTKNSKQAILVGGINFSSNVIVENNWCIMADYDNVISTTCIFIEASNSIVRNNYCQGAYFGICASASGTNALIYSNICYKNQRGIGIGTTTSGIVVYNNTISTSLLQGVEVGIDTTAIVKNNILFNCTVGVRMHGSATEDYNCYYGNGTDRALAGGTANWGINSIFTNPLINLAYRPKASSPLITTGTFIPFLQDKNSISFWVTPSIGAYEYVRPRNALTQVRTFR